MVRRRVEADEASGADRFQGGGGRRNHWGEMRRPSRGLLNGVVMAMGFHVDSGVGGTVEVLLKDEIVAAG